MTPDAKLPEVGNRGIWVAFILLAAAVLAAVTGVLSSAGGANLPNAVLAGGAAFVAATLFGFAVHNFMTGAGR